MVSQFILDMEDTPYYGHIEDQEDVNMKELDDELKKQKKHQV